MKFKNYLILLVCLASLAALPLSAISIRSLLGLDEEESKTEQTSSASKERDTAKATTQNDPNWAKSNKPVASGTVDLELIKRIFANLEPARRSALLADEATFAKFVQQEASKQSVISAARVNKVEQDSNTVFLMQRGADNILREVYLKKLIDEKLSGDFPSAQQIRDYFDKNEDKFVIAERVHVWQIFFPVDEAMDEKAVSALRKRANTIAQDIRKNNIDFNSAAIKYSKHAPSNTNGGYMGLIKTKDLKPGIQKMLLELKQGKTSLALTTDTGIHIVKRGIILPARKVNFDEGKAQIRTLLIKQVRVQLRKAIFEQAAKTYPVELSDNKIEEWRLRLRTNLETPALK